MFTLKHVAADLLFGLPRPRPGWVCASPGMGAIWGTNCGAVGDDLGPIWGAFFWGGVFRPVSGDGLGTVWKPYIIGRGGRPTDYLWGGAEAAPPTKKLSLKNLPKQSDKRPPHSNCPPDRPQIIPNHSANCPPNRDGGGGQTKDTRPYGRLSFGSKRKPSG